MEPDCFAIKNNGCIHKVRCARILAVCQVILHDKPVFVIKGFIKWLHVGGRKALGVLFPPVCLHCGAEVAQHGLVCPACFGHLQPVVMPYCKACATPQPCEAMLGASGLCPMCERHPPVWGQARAAFVYESVARELILKLKYADQLDNAAFLAQQMARIGQDILLPDVVIVPVPVHRWRLFRRRYNQAVLLAFRVAKLHGLNCQPDALVRIKATLPLAAFDRQTRQDALAQAILVRHGRESAVRDRDIVLVDDLLTTGATAAACTKALLGAGARSVCLLVAGVVPARAEIDMDLPRSIRQTKTTVTFAQKRIESTL